MKIKEILVVIFITLISLNNYVLAQDEEKKAEPKKVRLKLDYQKQGDGTKVLTSTLYWKEGKNINPVVNQEVTYYAEGDSSDITLGTIKSNEEGLAILYIENGFKFPTNEAGFTNFTAKMKKSDQFKRASKSIDIKDAELDFSFDVVDSIKIVTVEFSTLDSSGLKTPAVKSEVFIYVKRLYSLYKVESGQTDENGHFKIEFPNDLPGDSLGNLNLIVKILDSDEYGNIQKTHVANWGTVVSFDEEPLPRALWSGEAPLWMIIAVCIVLLGAWFNFGLAVYKVSQIRKSD